MADFRLGRLKFKWRGAWTASTAYVIDDIVKYGGNTYVCTTNHTAATSVTAFYSDVANWDLHVEGVDNKGTWTTTTWYKLNDIVKFGNTQYRCTTGHDSGASFDDTKFAVYLEGLNFEDNWVSGTQYQKGDIVTYRGYSYSSKTTHSSSTSPNADTTTAHGCADEMSCTTCSIRSIVFTDDPPNLRIFILILIKYVYRWVKLTNKINDIIR